MWGQQLRRTPFLDIISQNSFTIMISSISSKFDHVRWGNVFGVRNWVLNIIAYIIEYTSMVKLIRNLKTFTSNWRKHENIHHSVLQKHLLLFLFFHFHFLFCFKQNSKVSFCCYFWIVGSLLIWLFLLLMAKFKIQW